MIVLTEIMRQKDDQPFTQLLNRFRTAAQTKDDLECIQSRSVSPALHIFAENAPVDQHNNVHLECLSAPLHRLKATDHYPPNVTKQDNEKVLTRGGSETGVLDFEILVKENSRVMLTTNIDINDRLINGQMGTIKKIAKPSVIYVKQNGAVPTEPVLARIKVRPEKPSSPEIQGLQFSLTLTWACAVHKVQGLTLNEIVVSFDPNRQTHFNYGQIYVALSRATSLQGLHVIGQTKIKHVRANPKVEAEYHRMRQMENTCSNSSTIDANLSLKIFLLKYTFPEKT